MSTTRPAFFFARWYARLAPCTPPPITTMSAVPGRSATMPLLRARLAFARARLFEHVYGTTRPGDGRGISEARPAATMSVVAHRTKHFNRKPELPACPVRPRIVLPWGCGELRARRGARAPATRGVLSVR